MDSVLVQYGAWVWKIAALVFALFGLAVVRSVRASAARRRVRDEVATRTAEVSAPVLARAEGVVALTGTVRGGLASTLTTGGSSRRSVPDVTAAGGGDSYSDRAGEIWVDVGGERLDLGGPAHVLRGTSAIASRGVPRATPRPIRDALARAIDGGSRVSRVLRRAAGGKVHRLEQVRDGDRVIVRGLMAKQTAGVDRFGLRSWILAPLPDSREIEIVALSPAAPVVPLREPAALVLALVLAGAACGGMYALGKHELGVATQRSLSIAAAMPGSRAEALARLGVTP